MYIVTLLAEDRDWYWASVRAEVQHVTQPEGMVSPPTTTAEFMPVLGQSQGNAGQASTRLNGKWLPHPAYPTHILHSFHLACWYIMLVHRVPIQV
jgi:hypothetical protein